MTAPHVIDGVTLTDQTDFAAFVRDVLRGGGGVGSLRGDAQPLDWVLRAQTELAGSPYADRLTRGVAECMTAQEPEVRAQALTFFQLHPRAAGGERVRDLVTGDRRRFKGVPDPVHPGTDLDWQLLGALAAQLAAGDARTISVARAEALQRGQAQPLIAELASADRDWVVKNAEAIVRGTPAAGATILIQLQAEVPDLLALGRRIVPLCHDDPRFELDVSRFIDDAGVRQQLLDLFHGAGQQPS